VILHLGPSSSTSLSLSSVFLCRAPPPLFRPCAPPLPSLRCSGPRHVPPRPLPRRLPSSRWPPPALATSPAICPSCTSLPLAVAASPAPPPAFRCSTRHSSAVPPPSRPHAGPPLRPPRRNAPARAPPRPPRAPPRRQLLLAHGHLLFWTLSIFSSSFSTRLGSCTLLFQPFFPCSDRHRTPDLLRDSGSPSAAPTIAPHPRSEV
jgi:hypothetical protein